MRASKALTALSSVKGSDINMSNNGSSTNESEEGSATKESINASVADKNAKAMTDDGLGVGKPFLHVCTNERKSHLL
jgi:hypothetical protein